jgi:hypothetical protein
MAIRANKYSTHVAGVDLLFAKADGNNNPSSLGAINGMAGNINFSRTDIIGFLPSRKRLVPDGTGNVEDLDQDLSKTRGIEWQTTHANPGIVFETDPNSGQNVSVDRYWVAGIANGGFDLQGLVALNGAVTISGEDGTITDLDGTSPELVYAPGDILMVNDGVMLGEVAAAADTPSITFKFSGETSTNHARLAYLNHNSYTIGNTPPAVPADIAAWRSASGDLANNEIIYNVYPIRLTLHFSK